MRDIIETIAHCDEIISSLFSEYYETEQKSSTFLYQCVRNIGTYGLNDEN